MTVVAVEDSDDGSKSRVCVDRFFSLMRLTPSSTCGLLVSFLAISVTTAQPALESEHKGVTTHSEADTGPVDHSQPGVSVRKTPFITLSTQISYDMRAQMPLDVDNYPSAPPGLELQQVHGALNSSSIRRSPD